VPRRAPRIQHAPTTLRGLRTPVFVHGPAARRGVKSPSLRAPSPGVTVRAMAGLTYRDAGVDIDAGDELVDRIKPLAARTRIAEVMAGVGGFAGLCSLPS